MLWASGISFGGVLAFLYADLIVLPLFDVYSRYYGWRMAAYIGGVFYATIVLSGLLMDLAFTALGLVPTSDHNIRAEMTHFSLNYTFWLKLAFDALAAYLIVQARRHSMDHSRMNHAGHDMAGQGHEVG